MGGWVLSVASSHLLLWFEGGSVAEVTTAEQQAEINYQFLIWKHSYRRNLQESWHINGDLLFTWIAMVCFTADVPEMTQKSLCLDVCMALSFEVAGVQKSFSPNEQWHILLTFETLWKIHLVILHSIKNHCISCARLTERWCRFRTSHLESIWFSDRDMLSDKLPVYKNSGIYQW